VRYTVGVDLGSTTTKAVILDEQARVLGRGITNSRSNYDVACQVAMGEALNDTRFSMVRQSLLAGGLGEQETTHLLKILDLRFKEQQYLDQLRALRGTLEEHLEIQEASSGLKEAIASILDEMERKAGEFFREGASRKSDFFRDLAGSQYMELAEDAAGAEGASFDQIVGYYDKAILVVENLPPRGDTFREHGRAVIASLPERIPELEQAVLEAAEMELVQAASVGTGYGRARLPFPKASIRSEILCHGLGAHAMFPGTRTVLDIGGQDTKAIQVDAEGIVTSFQMNDRCAAGCGRYLGYIADEMNLGLHELGPLAQKSTRRVRINSTCTVFAGAELRERLSLGEKREDILAGLHRAIILRAMSLLARSGGVSNEFTFTGGVANNPAAVKALRDLIHENYGEITINISPQSIYTGALGAALFAHRESLKVMKEAG